MAISNGFNLGACLVWGATVAAMVCIAATEWARVTIDTNFFQVTVSYGLYRMCREFLGNTDCEYYDDEDVEEYHQVSRILSTTGMCVFIVASLLLALYMFMFYKDRSKYKAIWSLLVAMICTCVAGILNIVGVGLYARHNKDQDTPYLYWAFYIYIITTIVGVVGGFLAYFGRPSPVHPTNAVNGTAIATTSTVTYHHQRQHQQHPHYTRTVVHPPYQPQGSNAPPYGTPPPPYGAPTGSYSHSPFAAAVNPAYPPTGQGYPPSAYPPPPGQEYPAPPSAPPEQGYPAPSYLPPGQDQVPAYPPPNPVKPDPVYPPRESASSSI